MVLKLITCVVSSGIIFSTPASQSLSYFGREICGYRFTRYKICSDAAENCLVLWVVSKLFLAVSHKQHHGPASPQGRLLYTFSKLFLKLFQLPFASLPAVASSVLVWPRVFHT